MAQPQGEASSANERVFPLEKGLQYFAAYCDSPIVTSKSDAAGALVEIFFARHSSVVAAETIRTSIGDDASTAEKSGTITTEEKKIIECSILMRPDHCFGLALAIINHLNKFPEKYKVMYGLPIVHGNEPQQ